MISVKDPSCVHRVQVCKCSARVIAGYGCDGPGRATAVFPPQRGGKHIRSYEGNESSMKSVCDVNARTVCTIEVSEN